MSANGTPIATHPVDTIITTVDPDYSPAKEYGGTWERFGQGKVLVGFDEGDSDFNEVLKTGGEKTHTLNLNEMPLHEHGIRMASTTGGNWTFVKNNVSVDLNTTGQITTGTTGIALATGGGQSHNNLQPYVVVYRWRRVA